MKHAKSKILCILMLFMGWQNLAASQKISQAEVSLGFGLGNAFIRVGRMHEFHGFALRYFSTSSVFSEHSDDHKEIGALAYLNMGSPGFPISLRLGAGAALCFVETYPESGPVLGLPIDMQIILRLGRRFSLGLYNSITLNTLKKYGGFGIAFSLHL